MYLTNFRVRTYLLYTLVLFSVFGTPFLQSFGYQMGAFASSDFTKFHPLTYIVLIIIFIEFLLWQNITVRYLFSRPVYFVLIVFVGIIYFFLYLNNFATSISFLIDTLCLPILIACILSQYGEKVRAKSVKFIFWLLIFNCLFSVFERLVNHNFFPVNVGYGEQFRSTALLGHPLNNGLVCLTFYLYILSYYDISIFRIIIQGLIILSLICFGSRGCLYIAIISSIVFSLFKLFNSKILLPSKINEGKYLAFLGFMLMFLFYLIVNTSLGERFMDVGFFDDSAEVRFSSWNLIDTNMLLSYLWPTSPLDIEILMNLHGINIIENFIVVWILKFGLLFSSILIILLIYFMFTLRAPITAMRISTVLFFMAANTNNSLSTSTTALIVFTILFSSTKSTSGV